MDSAFCITNHDDFCNISDDFCIKNEWSAQTDELVVEAVALIRCCFYAVFMLLLCCFYAVLRTVFYCCCAKNDEFGQEAELAAEIERQKTNNEEELGRLVAERDAQKERHEVAVAEQAQVGQQPAHNLTYCLPRMFLRG